MKTCNYIGFLTMSPTEKQREYRQAEREVMTKERKPKPVLAVSHGKTIEQIKAERIARRMSHA